MTDPTLYVREGSRFRKAENAEMPVSRGVKIPRAPVSNVSHMQQAILRLAGGILANSDTAFRVNRHFQRNMRKDPDVMGPLLQRETAVSLLEWDIVPEDESDETQVEQAATLTQLIRRHMRKPHEFVRQLSEAVWFGPAACMIDYRRVDGGLIAPVKATPIHPDALAWTDEGKLGMYVGQSYKGEKTQGEFGPVHLFDEVERRAVVLNTWMPEGPSYDEPYDARYIFSGRGLRDVLYYLWMIKHTILQLSVTYAERYGMGTRVGRYPYGNIEARDEMEEAMNNLVGDVALLLPTLGGTEAGELSFEIHEPSGSNVKIFSDLGDYLGGQIKELLIGQTATTEGTSSGLGSSVGDQHAETFGRLIRYDAKTEADSLTFDFIHPLHEMNFGPTPYRPRWEFKIEDVDTAEFMQGVKDFVDLGGEVPEGQVRGRLGIREAEDGEPVLSRDTGGLGDQMGLFGDVGEPFNRVRSRKAVGGRA